MDYSFAKSTIFGALYDPLGWSDFADNLALLLSSNATTLAAYSDSLVGTTLDTPASIASVLSKFTAVSSIHCADRKPRVSTFDEFRPVLDELYDISSVYGDGSDLINMHCAQWKIEPKERYEGGFEVSTQNPVLFIGNTWDPYTPLLSAHNVSTGFNGSVVLEVQGYGVSIPKMPSLGFGRVSIFSQFAFHSPPKSPHYSTANGTSLLAYVLGSPLQVYCEDDRGVLDKSDDTRGWDCLRVRCNPILEQDMGRSLRGVGLELHYGIFFQQHDSLTALIY